MQMVNSCSADIQCDVSVDITATVVVRRGCQNVIILNCKLCRVEEHQHQLAHQCSPNIIGIWEWGICGLMVVTITSETNDAVAIVLLMNMSDVSFIYGRL